jgi:hypothetical protein
MLPIILGYVIFVHWIFCGDGEAITEDRRRSRPPSSYRGKTGRAA